MQAFNMARPCLLKCRELFRECLLTPLLLCQSLADGAKVSLFSLDESLHALLGCLELREGQRSIIRIA